VIFQTVAFSAEIATRAGHTSVSVVLDRYGHLLPGTEERTTDALELLGRAAANGLCDKRATVLKMGPIGPVSEAETGT
jgi:hypothetical protein